MAGDDLLAVPSRMDRVEAVVADLVGGYRITDVAETEAERLRVLIDLHWTVAQAS